MAQINFTNIVGIIEIAMRIKDENVISDCWNITTLVQASLPFDLKNEFHSLFTHFVTLHNFICVNINAVTIHVSPVPVEN